MNEQFMKPKGFGEILDQTFRLARRHFKDFFMIMLIMLGPVYLLQALLELASGTGFFREVGTGENLFDQFINSVDQSATSTSLASDLGFILLGFASIILLPVGQAAILYMVDHIRKNESYTVGGVLKRAFSRFWPIFGSSLLIGLIAFGMIMIPLIFIFIAGFVSSIIHPAIGIILGILLFLGIGLVVALLLTRWSFYLGVVAFGDDAPGLSASWRLTQKRTWVLFGLYLIFSLIIGAISTAVEFPIMFLLGSSVLYTIILNLVSLVTTVVFSVGYAVMYFDAKVRVGADDLKEMIDDYKE